MSSNQEKIVECYTGNSEDGRQNYSRNDSLEFYYTKKHLDGLIKNTDRVLEIGCATGYYGFYYADKCKEYVGVDLMDFHIDTFNKKIRESGVKNLSCQVGDATDLENIANDSFDVVLCLGPMYHLPLEERKLVFAECSRVCKTGGIVAFAYITSIGTYAGACVYDDWRKTYPNEKTNDYILNKGTDDERPELFFFTMPEEMESIAKEQKLTKIKNLGTNFMCFMKIVNDMTDERFEVLRPLHDKMCEHESCTGMAGHALLVCSK
ncbi:class I SAM-dependent methyltransferase [Paludicola sp. MB14-C6]|uniref:class I SAM-dependent methyltransferase n=1 Tax=Paludihabitans sp. MB14-C6 TaxID=3070656 RepID=UPI0027DB684C|nr:class I SAM-dependent methyltransferase [Paludicola sp. MB14-C6]WMJ22157.1 class I SAM-dependent methyltransferase [Paludicola sp. MB14-C6]